MGCRIADNRRLQELSNDLGLDQVCHSLRPDCHMGFQKRSGQYTLGSIGAAIGYCQGLFNRTGSPPEHTGYVAEKLGSIGAPLPFSHELLWGYRKGEAVSDYINQACKPLLNIGRVPIIITDLDPEKNKEEIDEIFGAAPSVPVSEGETMLVRLMLNSKGSIPYASDRINDIVSRAKAIGSMPKMFPLLQADFGYKEWDKIKRGTGNNWRYVNIAIGPFTDGSVMEEHAENITVAQFFVGDGGKIHRDGDVSPHATCDGSPKDQTYNIYSFAEQVKSLGSLPTSIVCGPSKPEWTESDNIQRLERCLIHFEKATEIMWDSVEKDARNKIRAMKA